ncbi:DegT/DnrJ/EryC1/StrS family aminotransferase [bacterium]|nr:MAG: DegT/DnrJ/EryC1/StrS family aminotransferase [bacterium]
MKNKIIQKVPVMDLVGQYKEIRKDVLASVERVMLRGDFVLGKEVAFFEKGFAKYCKSKFCVGVNSGTDALFLALKSLGIGVRDEVIVPAFTYIASSLAVTYTGATPVFVDIDEQTYNIDVTKIEGVITKNTKAIIPVHLYGQSAQMGEILSLARKHNLKVVEDTAQAQGAKYKTRDGKWKMAGGMGDIGCFSFYPTKNLGAFGDGGAIVTNNGDIYKKLLMLRDYGRSSRYEHVTLGYNSRLDTIQAAILRIKLDKLDEWNLLRRKNADLYNKELKKIADLILPYQAAYSYHVYHQYVVRLNKRDDVVERLKDNGIIALIHYPIPLHLQEVYRDLGYRKGDFPAAEKVASEIISLPMYPNLKYKQIKLVCECLRKAIKV